MPVLVVLKLCVALQKLLVLLHLLQLSLLLLQKAAVGHCWQLP